MKTFRIKHKYLYFHEQHNFNFKLDCSTMMPFYAAFFGPHRTDANCSDLNRL